MPTDPFPKNDFSKASHHHHHHPTQTMDPDYKPNFSNFSSPWAAAQFFREQHQQQQNSVDYGRIMAGQLMGQDCDQEDKGSTVCDDREAMFEKPLTPSDVGKLNRLVIPKQHAERYFPLDGSGGSCEPGEKGVQLSFEDEDGKVWRFRYSYWNSSQSYVLTKGWSRFVKEKRLDAGDIVSFQRERTSGEKLFIGWRRRDSPSPQAGVAAMQAGTVAVSQWGPGLYPALPPYPAHPSEHSIGEHYGGLLHAGEAVVGSSPTPNSKRLRLFGVNLDCPTDGPEPDLPGGGGGETHMIFSPLPFNGSGS